MSVVKLWKNREGNNVENEDDKSDKISSIEILKERKSKAVLKLLNDIQKVEKVKPNIAGDDYIYRFHIIDRILIIPSSKMLHPSMFARRYLEEFNEMPHRDISGYWGLIVNALNEEGLIVHVEDTEENDEVYAAETFLNVIRTFHILKKEERDKYKNKKDVLFCHNSNLYFPREMVKKVIHSAHLNIKIQRLNQLITKYKIGAGTFRYGKESNETIRCWIFTHNLVSDSLISISNLPDEPPQNQLQEQELEV